MREYRPLAHTTTTTNCTNLFIETIHPFEWLTLTYFSNYNANKITLKMPVVNCDIFASKILKIFCIRVSINKKVSELKILEKKLFEFCLICINIFFCLNRTVEGLYQTL